MSTSFTSVVTELSMIETIDYNLSFGWELKSIKKSHHNHTVTRFVSSDHNLVMVFNNEELIGVFCFENYDEENDWSDEKFITMT